ncbi:MAG TPA: asparagine synthase-related protein [Solirubrobacteraceae bacterium]|nr:asparagine synthase-related protein [Solirubrobacteraceae bacterium]
MSGFAGIVQREAPVDAALLQRMTAAMASCGPDHREVWAGGAAGLGHALLAAAADPPDAERQPCTLDGRTYVAADARIDGVAPGTPDAHRVLRAYAAHGERCVEHLIGDFAFAIWDAPRRRLFCARDHFGVVPFYYARDGDGLVVANVLRALLVHPAVSDELDEQAIGDFLLFAVNMDPATTAYADVRALPPGHTLTWEDGATRVRRYWEPPEAVAEARVVRAEDHVERFTAAFDAAVADRLRSSRAGAQLSGGMDSASVVATAHRVLRARGGPFDLRAYTIVYERLAVEEEGRYAQEAAEWLGIPLERLVAEDYATRAPEGRPAWVFPEPRVVAEHLAEYEIGRRVASSSRALLTGFGGDPLFSVHAGTTGWRDRAHHAVGALRAGRLPRYGMRTALRRRLRPPGDPPLPDWIRADFARRARLAERLRWARARRDAVPYPRLLAEPVWTALFAAAHPGAHGLPFRVLFPFFDLRVARAAWEAPGYAWRHDKRLLREAMRGRLPASVLERPKTPLYVPRGPADAGDPASRLAREPAVRRWRSDLVAAAPIGSYVDVDRALDAIAASQPARRLPPIDTCITLAHWLRWAFEEDRHGQRAAPV